MEAMNDCSALNAATNVMQETMEDIVVEMRRDCPARHMDGTMYRDGDWVYTKETVKRLADRIEAAIKQLCSDCAWYHIYRDGLLGLREENTRLRAALQPVLDIVMDSATSGLSMEMAITEAKRIYNGESEVKE